MEQQFQAKHGKPILLRMVRTIQQNKEYLSQIDGLIGDGDHGMNMNKGVTLFARRFEQTQLGFCDGLCALGQVLLNEIGGSMGPIYGTLFLEMAAAGAGEDIVDLPLLTRMLEAGRDGLYEIVDARVGDKTLIDTLAPTCDALRKAMEAGTPFTTALIEAKEAAIAGERSTESLVAKYGRSSRLGERSRGVLDAGAVSCCLLLCSMFEGILEILEHQTSK